jgi:DNA repair protein RecN (Recombination protein N)
MLRSLTVSNIVLIHRLTVDFEPGLTVLTGETGAGKSILLDSLGLALGARADFGLIRQGHHQAQVSASFHLEPNHPVWAVLDEVGIAPEDNLILRRRLKIDGKSSASINDVPVSVGFLHKVGDMLVEIQGQFEGRGLLDSNTHQALLDRAGDHHVLLIKTADSWRQWVAARNALTTAKETLAKAKADEDWLRDAVETLDRLAPKADEEEQIEGQRSLLANISKIAEGLSIAEDAVSGDMSAQAGVGRALAALERVAPLAGGRIDTALDALARACAELSEAASCISAAVNELEADPAQLQGLDDRLHEIRHQARKHGCDPSDLPAIHKSLVERLASIEDSSIKIGQLVETARQWQDYYIEMAGELHQLREQAAATLDAAVMAELPALKLGGARFKTDLTQLDETQWGPRGISAVRFEVSTNQGLALGPLDHIASGGELARFLLALKLCLNSSNGGRTLIFDEVDSNVGGAVAAAVGERLVRLGAQTQTLVITHSPQVAARGSHHLRIVKTATEDNVVSATYPLDDAQRTEEIARMLAGEIITDEARAAAVALLEA